jgi:hypothetical protein
MKPENPLDQVAEILEQLTARIAAARPHGDAAADLSAAWIRVAESYVGLLWEEGKGAPRQRRRWEAEACDAWLKAAGLAEGKESSARTECRLLWANAQLSQFESAGEKALVEGARGRRKPDTGQAEQQAAAVGSVVRKGLDELRAQAGSSALPRGNYMRYRSAFLQVLGRVAWQERTPEGFHRAYRLLESARAGLGDRDFIARSAPDLYAAECALAHAEYLLTRADAADSDAVWNSLAEANLKFDIAQGYLRAARHHLRQGRRNAIWWRFYYQLQAQYRAQRNLLRVANLQEELNSRAPEQLLDRGVNLAEHTDRVVVREISRFIRSLQIGFQAVSLGLGYQLRHAEGDRRDWRLVRSSCELVVGAVCYGALRTQEWRRVHRRGEQSAKALEKRLPELWWYVVWLYHATQPPSSDEVQTVRLAESVAQFPEAYRKVAERFKSAELKAWFDPGKKASSDGLTLRKRLLELAQDLFKGVGPGKRIFEGT